MESTIKLLVCEDDPNLGSLLAQYLVAKGYQVEHRKDGKQGWDAYNDSDFDLLILDVMMPLMDGVGLCRAVQAQPDARDIPLVLMSAGRKPVNQDGCHYAAFIPKPFELTAVLEVIASLI